MRLQAAAITRRRFLRTFAGMSAAPPVLRGAVPDKPNVLFLSVDDLNDWVGCLGGHPQVRTPHIDALARRGVLFTRAYCQAPICNPSRTSILTGLRPSTSGVYNNNVWIRDSRRLKGLATLPQHFSRNGYRTYASGKIFHEFTVPRPCPGDLPCVVDPDVAAEFDVVGPRPGYGPVANPPVNYKPGGTWRDYGRFPERPEDNYDWPVADWAIERMSQRQDQPWLMCLGFYRPHVPMFAPPEFYDLYGPEADIRLPPEKADDRDDLPPAAISILNSWGSFRWDWVREHGHWRRIVQSYLASVTYVDSQVGRVMSALQRRGLLDSTLIVLWGDHGWHLGEKQRFSKWTLWERSARVPLMVAGPGIRPGGRCERTVELLDLYPTLADLCRLPRREGLEGQSLRPLLMDPHARRDRPAITTFLRNNHAARTERWRYLRYADGGEELYDHSSDPNEWTNLLHDVAGREKFARVAEAHRRLLPSRNAPDEAEFHPYRPIRT